jgi:hypothetical protein
VPQVLLIGFGIRISDSTHLLGIISKLNYNTTEDRLRAELAESRAEVDRLRERMADVMSSVHKELSLISLVQKWPGAESAAPPEEFLASIDAAAKIGRWQDAGCLQIAALRLTETVKTFLKTNTELDAQDVTWEKFKSLFRERFRNNHTDQYHFTRLQTARQFRNEGPQEYADRCRALAQKVMGRSNNPMAQRIHRENAERMCLASFVAGLTGVPARKVRYTNPQNLQQALTIALSVTEGEKLEKGEGKFYAGSEKQPWHRKKRVMVDRVHKTNTIQNSQQCIRNSAKATTPTKCFDFGGLGHFATECPTGLCRRASTKKLTSRNSGSRTRNKGVRGDDRLPTTNSHQGN